MTRSEIINQLTEKVDPLNPKDAEQIVKTIFDLMTDALASGERIELRGFGSFSLKEQKGREELNLKTSETFHHFRR